MSTGIRTGATASMVVDQKTVVNLLKILEEQHKLNPKIPTGIKGFIDILNDPGFVCLEVTLRTNTLSLPVKNDLPLSTFPKDPNPK